MWSKARGSIGVVLVVGLAHLAGSPRAQQPGFPVVPDPPEAESPSTRELPETLEELQERFEGAKAAAVSARQEALDKILEWKGDDDAIVPFLIDAIKQERTVAIRDRLASGLGARARHAAFVAALPDLWPRLALAARLSLVESLEGLLAPEPREYLQERFWDGPTALQIALLPAMTAPRDSLALAFLEELFGREGLVGSVRLAAARSLRELAPNQSVDALAVALLEDRLPSMRAAAILALDGSEPPRLLARLSEILDREVRTSVQPVPAVAAAIAERLADLQSPQAQELFFSLAATRATGLTGALRELARRFHTPDCVAWWISRGLRSRDPELRILAIWGLSGSGESNAVQALMRALRDTDDQVRREAARGLGRTGSTEAASTLERMTRQGPLESRIEALDALHLIKGDDPDWKAHLVRLTGSPIEALQARALDLLAELGDPEVFPRVERLARTRRWMVRSAFYAFAGAVRDPRAIPLLIERLSQETGRLQGEVENALLKITGLTFGLDPRRWNEWWAQVKDGYEPPAEPSRPKTDPHADRYARYYGIPVMSQRVIFILDISGSMAARMGTGGETRLDRAKDALTDALSRFQRETFFNIIYFHTTIGAWERQLTPALPEQKRRALAYVRALEPLGATNIHDALELAFSDQDVDTIFLLSDGVPNVGKISDPGRLQEEILAWNLTRRIVIHTIALGLKSDLLRGLAERSGGQYVEI